MDNEADARKTNGIETYLLVQVNDEHLTIFDHLSLEGVILEILIIQVLAIVKLMDDALQNS